MDDHAGERMGEGPRQREEEESSLVTLARYSGHGLTLALAVGLFLTVGWWIDGRLGSTPLFTILGAMLGAAAGFYHIVQHLLLLPSAREQEREEKGDTDSGPLEGSG